MFTAARGATLQLADFVRKGIAEPLRIYLELLGPCHIPSGTDQKFFFQRMMIREDGQKVDYPQVLLGRRMIGEEGDWGCF